MKMKYSLDIYNEKKVFQTELACNTKDFYSFLEIIAC
jgi:hypothetical protein